MDKNWKETNRQYAVKLSQLILDNPTLPVIVWIDSDGIDDDYDYWKGNFEEPQIEIIAVTTGRYDERYVRKEDDVYEDCLNYYGDEADNWSEEELTKKALRIPWKKVISIRCGIG